MVNDFYPETAPPNTLIARYCEAEPSYYLIQLSHRRAVIRPLPLRPFQLQRFLMLRSAILLPLRLDAVQPCDNRRS